MRLRDTISISLGGSALLASVLGVGGVLREVQAAVAVLVALALATNLLSRSRIARPSPLLVLISLAALLTLLQLIPLPDGLLHALDPTGDSLRTDGAKLAQTSPWQTISLDPPGTLRALTYFITLLGVATLGVRYAATERGRFLLLAGVALTCGLAAVVSGAHRLVAADSLYGLYTPAHMKSVGGPLLNPNHLGGLMAIGATLSLGLAFYKPQPTQLRVAWVVITFACVAMCAVTLSRGAIVGMLLGMSVTVGIVLARLMASGHRRSQRTLQRNLPIAIVIGLGIALALYLSAGNVVDQLAQTSLSEFNKPISKYEAWRSSFQLLRESPIVGVGRGAVEATLTRVHPASGWYTFSHLENEFLSAFVEWGVPGTLVLALAFGWCVSAAVRRWKDGALAAAALGALAMITFQSCVDFGVELLGLAVPVTIIACTVQLVPVRPTASRLRAAVFRLLMIGALLACAVLLLLPLTTTVEEDHDHLLELDRPTMADVRETIERHPLDYFGFGEATEVAARDGDPHAVEYVNHALELHPTHPELHRLTARMLVALKLYKQAGVEYSLALSAAPMPHQLMTEIVTLVPDPADATACIPLDYPNTEVLLHSLNELKRTDISLLWLARVATQPQHDVRMIDTLYNLAIEQNALDTAKSAALLRLSVAHTTTSRLMLAKVQLKLGELDVLVSELADVKNWIGRTDEKGAAWLILCDVYIQKEQWEPATECLHHLDGSGLLGAGHYEINTRLQDITNKRSYESKLQGAQALQRELDAKPRPPPAP